MSLVTSVVLVCKSSEPELAKILDQGDYGKLALLQESEPGGHKWMEVNLYVGGFNYFDFDALLERVKAHPWIWPECTSLFALQEGKNDRMTQRWP